jgi:predicted RNA-binding Zn-ribbon protein involved in translation (DUF1610 family)
MAIATQLTERCSACGAEIPLEARANFCPACGMPLNAVAESTAQARRTANRGLAMLVLLSVAGVLALGLLMWRLTRAFDPGDSGAGPAAQAMDEFAPVAEDWIDKRQHITDEAGLGDADGVVLAVDDALAWTEVAVDEVAHVADGVDGNSAPLYRQLVAVFRGRLDALHSLEPTGGATATAAWTAGEAQLDALGAESDDLICQIAGEVRAEGDDPDAHVTPAMDVDC